MEFTTPTPISEECKNVTGIMNSTIGFKQSVTSGQAMLLMVLFGCFCAMLAKVMVILRVKVFKDKANVDRTFDAGGQLSMGITAATIVSEWTWAAAFVQSSNAATKYGLAGVYWYAMGATVQILIFSMICIELKIRAPGAKTYMQLIRTRFGTVAHILFCVYGLLINIHVTTLLVLSGSTVLTSLVQGMTVEFAATMILLVIGSFCFIGGVRATSYVSYFSTMLMMVGVIVFLFRVFHYPSQEMKELGSIETVYQLLHCSKGEHTNYQSSYLTFYSRKAFMFGMVNIIGNLGSVFMDQAYWQRSVASKPREGTWGFISAGFVWFAIPFTFATSVGLAYVCLGTLQGEPLLQPEEVEAGLVPAVVAERLLGYTGEVLIVFLLVLAVSSTGAAEIMAMVAILVYDVYGVYLKPYRPVVEEQKCLLCEKSRVTEDEDESVERCSCESMTSCVACGEDDRERSSSKQALKPMYKCRMHGKYRAYNDYLERLKDWAIVVIAILILPVTITLKITEVNQAWLYQFMGVLVSSGVFPLCLSMCWERQTGKGVVAGLLCGTVCGVVAWIVHASMQEGGLSQETFMDNTGKIEVMLTGNCVSILSGLVICVVISWITPPSEGDLNLVWRRTLDIDNPLSPWTEIYAEELALTGDNRLNNQPPLSQMLQVFRFTRLSTLIGATSATALILVLGPLVMLTISIFSYTQFFNWIVVVHIWAIGGAIYIIVMPLLTEFRDFHKVMTGGTHTFQRHFDSESRLLGSFVHNYKSS